MRRQNELAAGVTLLVLFAADAAVVMLGITQQYDAQLALLMNRSLGGAFTALMVAATSYGREYVWTLVVAALLIFGDRDTKVFAVELAALFVVGIAAGEILKYTLYRPRPFEAVGGIVLRIAPDADSSFPSGHALIVSIGAISSILRLKRRRLATLLTLEAVVVCYSRVYLGMHYPLDVLGGALLGGAIALLGLFVLERYLGRYVGALVALIERSMRPSLKGVPVTRMAEGGISSDAP